MKVLILGAGAMGCLYGAAFHRAGCEVVFVDVNQPHIDAINAHGLELETRAGTELLPIPARLPERDRRAGRPRRGVHQDLPHRRGARRHRGGDRAGDLAAQPAERARQRPAAGGACGARSGSWSARARCRRTSSAPARCAATAKAARSSIRRSAAIRRSRSEVCDLLTAGGLPAALEPDIHGAIWSKAIFNATMNPLCALTRRTPGFLGAHEESRALIHALVEEGVAVANASGVAIPAQPIHDLTHVSVTDHANHEASMLQDVKAGRRTEVDAINGAIVEAARAAGVAAPLTETLWRLVKLEEAKLAEG